MSFACSAPPAGAPAPSALDASSTDATPPSDDAASADADRDAGPAYTPTLPQAINVGGSVLAAPHIVPIVWSSDELLGDIETFLGAFGSTTYWADMVAEYGVAKVTVDPTVRVTDAAPAAIDDGQIQTWLAAHIGGAAPALPAPTAGVVYAFFYPKGTSITMQGGTSCTSFHGYHDELALDGGAPVSYAVISRCASAPEVNVTGVQYVSAVASHELIEAFTDPLPNSKPAWQDVDEDHRAWVLGTSSELGDLCALQGDAFFTPPDFPYTVQKIWSNAAAKAGHDPCVPQKSAYFNSIPRVSDTIAIPGFENVRGTKIPVGQSRDVTVDLYSDAPTAGPWTVGAMEILDKGNLALSFDRTSGIGGDRVTLTIKSLKASANGFEAYAITSTLGGRRNLWFGVIGH